MNTPSSFSPNNVPFRLYIISDDCSYPGRLRKYLPDLLKLGNIAIQMREKYLSPREQTQFIQQLQDEIPPSRTSCLYINDRADLALNLGLTGVHLREDSGPCNLMHPVLKQTLSVGVSTHSIEGVLQAEEGGANFVTLGPIFYTSSKAKYGSPLGLEYLRKATECSKIPIFALGGITPEKVEQCINAGAYGVSMISSVWEAVDPVNATKSYLKELIRAQISMRLKRR